ncbi:MAG: deoxyribonuclease IV [Actinomycetota bacterium]|nr:deoxyribonuclease IV [Actinomycetota bacterium]
MPERTSRIGRHLPTSGGLGKTLEAARELGCETAQIFVSNPQGWAAPAPRPDAEAFAEGRRKLGLSPVVAHAKYLINLASPYNELRRRSTEALAWELVAAGALGVDLVVVHAGSHGGDGEEKGMDRLVDGLDRVRKLAAGFAGASGRVAEPVVENSVGAGTQLCSTFEALGEAVRRAGVRVCLDTAHAFVAGYDLSTPGGARSVAEELKNSVGPALALLHLNDARNGFGSHRDGHSKIGEGQIPGDTWGGLFAGLPGIPAVLETPYGGPEADAEEVQLVKELAGGLLVLPREV